MNAATHEATNPSGLEAAADRSVNDVIGMRMHANAFPRAYGATSAGRIRSSLESSDKASAPAQSTGMVACPTDSVRIMETSLLEQDDIGRGRTGEAAVDQALAFAVSTVHTPLLRQSLSARSV